MALMALMPSRLLLLLQLLLPPLYSFSKFSVKALGFCSNSLIISELPPPPNYSDSIKRCIERSYSRKTVCHGLSIHFFGRKITKKINMIENF